METPYGAGVDPAPYMIAAFGLAVLLLGGYTMSIYFARAKIRRLMVALSSDKDFQHGEKK
jgi:hypothetical protein